MTKNPWLKLAAVSFAGIITSYALLWGVNQFSGYTNQSSMNQYGMQNTMNSYDYGMNMQGNVNIQGNMNSGTGMGMMDNMMGMMDNMMGMNMQGNMNNGQSSMGMDMDMKMGMGM